jgi:hypothetical protein
VLVDVPFGAPGAGTAVPPGADSYFEAHFA